MKLVIDIPEMAYEVYKEWHKNKVATVEQSLIAQGAPYEERPHGEWIKVTRRISDSETSTHWECSICREPDRKDGKSKFCCECGAEMKKEIEEC